MPVFLKGLFLVSTLSPLAGLIVYWRSSKSRKAFEHSVALLLFASLISDLLTNFYVVRSELVFNIQDVIQFALICWFYYELRHGKILSIILISGITLYAIFLLVMIGISGVSVFLEYQNKMWFISGTVASIAGMVYTNTSGFKTVDKILDEDFDAKIILNGSLSFYAIGTLLLFLLTDVVFAQEQKLLALVAWSFHNVMNIFKNVGLAIGLSQAGKRKISISSEERRLLEQQLNKNRF